MADLNGGLILYLPLTEPLTNGPIDRSPLNHAVNVVGAPKLIADPLLGAAFQFAKGDFLTFGGLSELSTLDQPFTFQMWLKRNANSGPVPIAVFARDLSHPDLLFASREDGICGFRNPPDAAFSVQYPGCLMPGQWTHLALVGNGKQYSVYENGVLRTEGGPPVVQSPFHCQIFAIAGETALFAIAQIRVHNRVLTVDEINQQITGDMTLRTAYTESHPIVLSLLDADETAAISITDDPNGEPLTLEFFNAAQRPVFLDKIDGNPGAGSFHFEVRFRPGALHKLATTPGPNQVRLTGTADWVMSDPVAQPDGTVSLYLLHVAQDKLPFDIDSERTVRLKLINVRADPATGARASRIELRYAHLHVGDPLNTMLTGSRISYFSIVNRTGRKNLPVHVGFVSGNAVLPGSATGNQLRLRLVNVSPDQPIAWQPGNPANSAASFFRLSFDFQPDHEEKDWALARLNESKNIAVTAPNNEGGGRWVGTHTGTVQDLQDGQKTAYAYELEQAPTFALKDGQGVIYQYPPVGSAAGTLFATNHIAWPGLPPNQLTLAFRLSPQKGSDFYLWPPAWKVTPAPQGETPSWTIWSDEVVDVAQGEFVDLLISGIVTSLPPGHTNLYVDYGNIPGYQPGRFVAIIEKSPVVIRQDEQGNDCVGIGTDKPTSVFQVGEGIHMDSAGNLGVGVSQPQAKLHVYDANATNDHGAVVIGASAAADQPHLEIGQTADGSFIQAHGGPPTYPKPLRINTTGPGRVVIGNASVQVGIGVDPPCAPLDVGGHILIRRGGAPQVMDFQGVGYGDLLIYPPGPNGQAVHMFWRGPRVDENTAFPLYHVELTGTLVPISIFSTE